MGLRGESPLLAPEGGSVLQWQSRVLCEPRSVHLCRGRAKSPFWCYRNAEARDGLGGFLEKLEQLKNTS